MSLEEVLVGLLTIMAAVGGWLLRELWQAVKELRKDLQDLEVKIPETYVTLKSFDASVNRILDAIEGLRKDIRK